MTKQKKLRNLEYYDLQTTFDNLYEQSKNGAVFDKLMNLINSEETSNLLIEILNVTKVVILPERTHKAFQILKKYLSMIMFV